MLVKPSMSDELPMSDELSMSDELPKPDEELVNVVLRPATVHDQALLAQATLDNLNWDGERFDEQDLWQTPGFQRYFQPWPGEHDFGFIATHARQRAVGAIWLKFFRRPDTGYGFVDEQIPELSVWVAGPYRGQGIGGQLIHAAVDEAQRRGLAAICLSVKDGNPAVRLYERHRFRPAGPDAAAGTLIRHLG